MKSLKNFILLCLILVGCTPYRSADRKGFEKDYTPQAQSFVSSKASIEPNSALLKSNSESCRMIGKLESWILEEFPASNYELILSDEDLELWKTTKDSKVIIKSFQKIEQKIRHCTYSFDNEFQWQQYQEDVIKDLEATLMLIE